MCIPGMYMIYECIYDIYILSHCCVSHRHILKELHPNIMRNMKDIFSNDCILRILVLGLFVSTSPRMLLTCINLALR